MPFEFLIYFQYICTGMRDSGGHGGSSFAETNVPLIFIGPLCEKSSRPYKQIDIAATLSILLGQPIPANSIGSLMPNFLTQLTAEQRLYAYLYNCRRLVQKVIDSDGFHLVEAQRSYYKCLHGVKIDEFCILMVWFVL